MRFAAGGIGRPAGRGAAPHYGVGEKRLSGSLRWMAASARKVLDGTALFAMLWAIARAAVQSVTIDEADTYLAYAALPWPSHWYPAANNHVLNSILMRAITSVFGLSAVSVRAPALMGAAIYMAAAYGFCKLITRDLPLQWALFVCLVYNPFVFDYLVAARGYGLATGCLMCALVIPVSRVMPPERACAAASVCAALSFAANFSFAFVDAAALLMVFVWSRHHEKKNWRRLLAACTLPGMVVTLLLSASVAARFPKSQLVYGATSLRETAQSIASASWYELNPYVLNPLLYRMLKPATGGILLALIGAVLTWRLVLIVRQRRTADHALAWLGLILGGIGILTVAAHWLSFRLAHILLPQDRTAIYFAPLCTLLAGVIAAMPLTGRGGTLSRKILTVLLFALALRFVGSLRLTYFKEWKFDADMQKVYSVLAYYNHRYGIRDIASEWEYVSSLNFYRQLSGRESIAEFAGGRVLPEDRQVYVLYYPEWEGFIAKQGLKVVYHGELSDVAVAIRPEVERQRGSR